MSCLSVVVPIFNVEEYLPRCLDSLFEQNVLGAMEVILVDDGSSDSSPAICDGYLRQFTNVSVIHQENKGLSEARNAGFAAASGDWIFFLDADDWLAPKALSTLLGYAETQSCDMVVGSFYYAYPTYLLYDNRWFNNQIPFIMTQEEAMRELILQHFFKNFAWGKLYRTAIVKKHLFRPRVFFEDVYWQHLIVHDAQRVGVVTQPLYYYRQRTNSISGQFSERNLDLLKGSLERLDFLKKDYKHLVPLAEKKFASLVQTYMDAAEHSNNPLLEEAVFDFAQKNSIVRKNKSIRFIQTVLSRFTEKKPTIIPIK